MNRLVGTASALMVIGLLLSGCASRGTGDPSSSSGTQGGSRAGPTAGGPGAGRTTTSTGSKASGIEANVIRFDFDSSIIEPRYHPILDQWGAWLAASAKATVRLEGHADERGTREYNVGLGERRANAVLQALTARGASENQIQVISYGEERPIDPDHDEDAWSRNRRVELID